MNRRAQPWLGTLVEITSDASHEAIGRAFEAIALVHGRMSFHDTASDISRFNRAEAGDCLQVDTHTWQVLRLAEQFRAGSDGMFNPACAPRLAAWGSLPMPAAPAPEFVPREAAYRCDDDGMVSKLRPSWIDVGGIAKGYAVDLALEVLQQAGATAACVNAGGDLRVFGAQAWPVGIRDPLAPHRTHTQLMLQAGALATSGAYFSARTADGRQVSALVDGRDGQPMLHAHSVSVRAPLCVAADALTKIVMASGDPRHPLLAAWQADAFII